MTYIIKGLSYLFQLLIIKIGCHRSSWRNVPGRGGRRSRKRPLYSTSLPAHIRHARVVQTDVLSILAVVAVLHTVDTIMPKQATCLKISSISISAIHNAKKREYDS